MVAHVGVSATVAPRNLCGTPVNRPTNRRAGISLLEILISIGVVGIGLIGVAALIPLAHHKATEGVNTDRMASLGRRAFREFEIREFDRPGILNFNELWIGAPSSPGNYNVTGQALAVFYAPGSPDPDINYQPSQIRKQTYCFDPLGVADRNWVVNGLGASNGNALPVPHQFPSIAPAVGSLTPTLSIPRITIRTQRGASGGVDPTIKFPHADRIFRIEDDLVYSIPPEDESLPRKQEFYMTDLNGDNAPDYARRLNAGDFSWMATLVPETKSIPAPNGGPIPNTVFPTDSDRYTLSIVVFNRRVLYSKLLTPGGDAMFAANQFNQEIVGRVLAPDESPFTSSSAGATKEVHIQSSFNYVPQKDWQAGGPPAGVTWNDVQIGNWVCLYQLPSGQPNNAYTSPIVYSNAILKWYQVLATDRVTDATNEVILTLRGPDWTFYPNSLNAGAPPGSDFNTYAVFVNNVDTVYEKTVRLHNTSAFSQ